MVKIKPKNKANINWFNIETYIQAFKELTVNELQDEIRSRIDVATLFFCWDMIQKDPTLKQHQRWITAEYNSDEILAGRPVISKNMFNPDVLDRFLYTKPLKNMQDEFTYMGKFREHSCAAVFDVNILNLAKQWAKKQKGDLTYSENKEILFNIISTNYNMELTPPSEAERFFFHADIKCTDEEILASFKQLLNTIRKEFNIPEPSQKAITITDNTIKKILSYRILAIYDLQLLTAFAFDNKHLSQLIFPYTLGEIKSEEQINDTILPFMRKIMQDSFVSDLSKYIIQLDEYKKGTPINRWLEIN